LELALRLVPEEDADPVAIDNCGNRLSKAVRDLVAPGGGGKLAGKLE